jgi:hypothetical protein
VGEGGWLVVLTHGDKDKNKRLAFGSLPQGVVVIGFFMSFFFKLITISAIVLIYTKTKFASRPSYMYFILCGFFLFFCLKLL